MSQGARICGGVGPICATLIAVCCRVELGWSEKSDYHPVHFPIPSTGFSIPTPFPGLSQINAIHEPRLIFLFGFPERKTGVKAVLDVYCGYNLALFKDEFSLVSRPYPAFSTTRHLRCPGDNPKSPLLPTPSRSFHESSRPFLASPPFFLVFALLQKASTARRLCDSQTSSSSHSNRMGAL